ncbi:uncharacterized protein LOC120604454 isoform X1 [Pteropus medius]|uniref:uncharacterized protein LOC120604454 isoform X1 n=2 Tax=Pteropus vampyrus TaxID=132908 RepID=UPI00196B058C|nr:uncharacterized protein LOC120604454 isoform X1 [Pteropus giganteus]
MSGYFLYKPPLFFIPKIKCSSKKQTLYLLTSSAAGSINPCLLILQLGQLSVPSKPPCQVCQHRGSHWCSGAKPSLADQPVVDVGVSAAFPRKDGDLHPPFSLSFLSHLTLAKRQQKSFCELKTFCGDFHLLPKSLLPLSTAPSPPHRPCPLQRRKKSSHTPHCCHNRNMTGFQLKPKVTQQSFLPGCCAGGHSMPPSALSVLYNFSASVTGEAPHFLG